MIPNILRHFNWVDIIVLIFILRGVYRGAKNGIVLEFFSLSGWCAAIFFSFRFSKTIAQTLHERTEIPLVVNELLVFAAIVIAAIVITNIAGGILKRVIKIKIIERPSLFGGAALGLFKAGLILSVLFYAAGILRIPYLEKSIQERSLSGKSISRIVDIVYHNIEQILR